MSESIFDIRSDEVQEILGHIPGRITRWGIALVLVFIIILISGSWFFNYPDIILTPVTILTQNPPASIITRSTGKIENIFVKDNQSIDEGTTLAIIENTASYHDIYYLIRFTDSIKSNNNLSDSASFLTFKPGMTLGEVQDSYLSFVKSYQEFRQFFLLNYFNNKIRYLQKEIEKNRAYSNRLVVQKELLEKDIDLYQEKYRRDSLLYVKEVISLSQLEDTKSNLLKKKLVFEATMTDLANNQIRITQIDQDILDNRLKRMEKKNEVVRNLNDSFENLSNQLISWEYKYLLKSPVSGKVSFNKFWSPNQNVNTGDKVMTIVPDKPCRIIGKAELPIRGAGKVKIGQSVNIKLDNYPYNEFGMIKATVSSISLTPEDSSYSVELALPDGLKTNYNKILPFSQKLQGTAEIITENVSLLERIFNPLKLILKEHLSS
ncbi:MAG: HlyD family efflux transporter periplasmic adaptor subunit [Bacteroidia bacterium]|nr:HlyD family efflux transporter periplasmic adaptor subunit [Bacteroidia bacterium]